MRKYYIKNRSVIRSIFFTFLLYVVIFIYGTIPYYIKPVVPGVETLHTFYPRFYLLLTFVLGSIAYYLYKKEYFEEILNDIRPYRVTHYLLMLPFGVGLAMYLGDFSTPLATTSNFFFTLTPISLLFACLFSIVVNNIEDYEIDKVSNVDQSLVRGTIPFEHYKFLGLLFSGLAVFYAAAVNLKVLFVIVLFMGSYFLYSDPPLRLKRIPIVSKVAITFNSLILAMLAYARVGPAEILDFPLSVTVMFLVFLTLAFNFIDIKDYEGDKKAGIKTLPVLLGLKKAKY